jgi:hypothetical protein
MEIAAHGLDNGAVGRSVHLATLLSPTLSPTRSSVNIQLPEKQMIVALASAMFFSPCLEIGAFFLVAGTHGAWAVFNLSALYTITTVGGMVVWVQLVWHGLDAWPIGTRWSTTLVLFREWCWYWLGYWGFCINDER